MPIFECRERAQRPALEYFAMWAKIDNVMAKKDKSLRSIVELLKREFKPSRLILFGSQAAKTPDSESDFDFVMVLPKYSGDRMETWEKCNELIRNECGVLADVFTYSEAEFKKLKNEFSSIPETAVSTGIETLGASHWRCVRLSQSTGS